tara:strand:+ start:109 stop:216 length:108 start_codon:yes stop_codon:yes gene_type:complete
MLEFIVCDFYEYGGAYGEDENDDESGDDAIAKTYF